MANGKSPLLAVQNFIMPIVANNPIHRIQGKTFGYAVYHRLLLLVIPGSLNQAKSHGSMST